MLVPKSICEHIKYPSMIHTMLPIFTHSKNFSTCITSKGVILKYKDCIYFYFCKSLRQVGFEPRSSSVSLLSVRITSECYLTPTTFCFCRFNNALLALYFTCWCCLLFSWDTVCLCSCCFPSAGAAGVVSGGKGGCAETASVCSHEETQGGRGR